MKKKSILNVLYKVLGGIVRTWKFAELERQSSLGNGRKLLISATIPSCCWGADTRRLRSPSFRSHCTLANFIASFSDLVFLGFWICLQRSNVDFDQKDQSELYECP